MTTKRPTGCCSSGGRGAPMLRRDQFYDAAWRPALRAAGLAPNRFTFHTLRHFCASMLLAEGAPLTWSPVTSATPWRR